MKPSQFSCCFLLSSKCLRSCIRIFIYISSFPLVLNRNNRYCLPLLIDCSSSYRGIWILDEHNVTRRGGFPTYQIDFGIMDLITRWRYKNSKPNIVIQWSITLRSNIGYRMKEFCVSPRPYRPATFRLSLPRVLFLDGATNVWLFWMSALIISNMITTLPIGKIPQHLCCTHMLHKHEYNTTQYRHNIDFGLAYCSLSCLICADMVKHGYVSDMDTTQTCDPFRRALNSN